MASKLVLCRTRLEEAASQLRELVAREELEPDMQLRLVSALDYLDKAVELLRRHAEQHPGEEA
jgi:hypothetical protein